MTTLSNAILQPNLAHRFVVTFLTTDVGGKYVPVEGAEVLTGQVVSCRVINDVHKPVATRHESLPDWAGHQMAPMTELSVVIEDDASNLAHKAIFEGLANSKNPISVSISHLDGDDKILRHTTYFNAVLETVQQSDLNYGCVDKSSTGRIKIRLPDISPTAMSDEQRALVNLVYHVVDSATISTEIPKDHDFYNSQTHQFRLVFNAKPENVKTVYMTDRTKIEESRK